MTETSPALGLWAALTGAARGVEESLRVSAERHGLTSTEFAVLHVLLANGGALPLGEIGGCVLRASGSMTYVIDKLQSRGLLRRRACATDRRVVYGELTDAGRTLIERAAADHDALLAQLTACLSPDERAAAISLLERLADDARAHSPAAPAAAA